MYTYRLKYLTIIVGIFLNVILLYYNAPNIFLKIIYITIPKFNKRFDKKKN